MSRKRVRITNPEPFSPFEAHSTIPTKKPKRVKKQQVLNHLVPSDISTKIMDQALLQQKEIRRKEETKNNPNRHTVNDKRRYMFLFRNVRDFKDNKSDDEYDDFDGFSETRSLYGQWDIENEMLNEDEELLESFLSNDNCSQTLGDIVVKKINETDALVSSGVQSVPKLDASVVELYKGVGKLLAKYTSGKMPKAFKHIPSMQMWEKFLVLTESENWSPNAMYEATRIFSSNMGVKKAERFFKYVLLPRVREDIRKNKRLHFALYKSLKKALYKPEAVNKGILFPLCESRTCTLREAAIFGSIIKEVSIPPLHSSVALLKLAQMEYCGTTSYFMKLLIEKKYALPYRVLEALVAHFTRFFDDSTTMPVIWHQSLLAFAQTYKNELTKDDKADLNSLGKRHTHELVTPEILRELNNSRNRGEKEDLMSISTSIHVVYKTIQEDRFDIPDVPVEED